MKPLKKGAREQGALLIDEMLGLEVRDQAIRRKPLQASPQWFGRNLCSQLPLRTRQPALQSSERALEAEQAADAVLLVGIGPVREVGIPELASVEIVDFGRDRQTRNDIVGDIGGNAEVLPPICSRRTRRRVLFATDQQAP